MDALYVVSQNRGRVIDRKNVMAHTTTKLICKAQFCLFLSLCLYVCLDFSETAARTNIKLGTIDHLLVVSAIKGFVTS